MLHEKSRLRMAARSMRMIAGDDEYTVKNLVKAMNDYVSNTNVCFYQEAHASIRLHKHPVSKVISYMMFGIPGITPMREVVRVNGRKAPFTITRTQGGRWGRTRMHIRAQSGRWGSTRIYV